MFWKPRKTSWFNKRTPKKEQTSDSAGDYVTEDALLTIESPKWCLEDVGAWSIEWGKKRGHLMAKRFLPVLNSSYLFCRKCGGSVVIVEVPPGEFQYDSRFFFVPCPK